MDRGTSVRTLAPWLRGACAPPPHLLRGGGGRWGPGDDTQINDRSFCPGGRREEVAALGLNFWAGGGRREA